MAEETVVLRRRALVAVPAVVDGAAGLVVAPMGRLALALRVVVAGGRVAAFEVIAAPARLRALDVALAPVA